MTNTSLRNKDIGTSGNGGQFAGQIHDEAPGIDLAATIGVQAARKTYDEASSAAYYADRAMKLAAIEAMTARVLEAQPQAHTLVMEFGCDFDNDHLSFKGLRDADGNELEPVDDLPDECDEYLCRFDDYDDARKIWFDADFDTEEFTHSLTE